MISNFDFNKEYASLREKFPSISNERAEYFLTFLKNDRGPENYRSFLRTLNNEEFFFVFDLEHLLTRRNIKRLHEFLVND